jgi:hypothetical protein
MLIGSRYHGHIGKYLVQQNSKHKAKKGEDSDCHCQTGLASFTVQQWLGQFPNRLVCLLPWPTSQAGSQTSHVGVPAMFEQT